MRHITSGVVGYFVLVFRLDDTVAVAFAQLSTTTTTTTTTATSQHGLLRTSTGDFSDHRCPKLLIITIRRRRHCCCYCRWPSYGRSRVCSFRAVLAASDVVSQQYLPRGSPLIFHYFAVANSRTSYTIYCYLHGFCAFVCSDHPSPLCVSGVSRVREIVSHPDLVFGPVSNVDITTIVAQTSYGKRRFSSFVK